MEINLILITHHPTLFTAVLGFQQAWDMLPIGIAFSLPVTPTSYYLSGTLCECKTHP